MIFAVFYFFQKNECYAEVREKQILHVFEIPNQERQV